MKKPRAPRLTKRQIAVVQVLAQKRALIEDTYRCENSLYEFVKSAWEVFDPAAFQGNWHLEDECLHFEAVIQGYINRLLINVPPRTAKSSVASICFPAWVWAQRNISALSGPQVSFFYASYAENLAHEHSLKCRRLIESNWYQERWGARFQLVADRNKVGHFENDKGGYRMSSSVGARATGWGADILVADDPHLVQEAESQDVREKTVRWWAEAMPSRLNNRRTGAMIVIMQRVHEGDVSGHVLKQPSDYVHFCVPMLYIPVNHANAWVDGRIETILGDEVAELPEEQVFWVDRRREDGELLWPDRYGIDDVRKLEREMGPYAFAGQYQQIPAPRGGGILRQEWWKDWDDDTAAEFGAQPGCYPPFEYILASVDTAYTEKEENDPSAMSVWGLFRDKAGNPKIFLIICWEAWLPLHDLVQKIGNDCKRWKVDRLLIEDKAAGHSVAQEMARLFNNFALNVDLVDPRTGFIKSPDKEARLHTVVHMYIDGMIYAPDKEWADHMKNQCATVPRAIHDDLCDSMTQALLWLRRSNYLKTREEMSHEQEEERRYRRPLARLYPV